MKKKILLLLVLICSLFFVTACGADKKEEETEKFAIPDPVTVEEFTAVAEKKDMDMADVIDQFTESTQVKTANVAYIKDEWQLEHYTLISVEEASDMFERNRESFEQDRTSTSTVSDIQDGAYAKYILETEDKYKVLIQVKTMFIYGNVPIEYKEDAKAFIKELGY